MTPFCSSCGQPFSALGLFDEHRVGAYDPRDEDKMVGNPPHRLGPRRCLTVDEMLARGWRRTERTWRGPAPSPEEAAKLEELRAQAVGEAVDSDAEDDTEDEARL